MDRKKIKGRIPKITSFYHVFRERWRLVRPEIYERSRRKQYYRREIKKISRINSCPQIPSATQKFYWIILKINHCWGYFLLQHKTPLKITKLNINIVNRYFLCELRYGTNLFQLSGSTAKRKRKLRELSNSI